MGCTLAPPEEYDWTVHVRRQCGLMSKYFHHLYNFVAVGWHVKRLSWWWWVDTVSCTCMREVEPAHYILFITFCWLLRVCEVTCLFRCDTKYQDFRQQSKSSWQMLQGTNLLLCSCDGTKRWGTQSLLCYTMTFSSTHCKYAECRPMFRQLLPWLSCACCRFCRGSAMLNSF